MTQTHEEKRKVGVLFPVLDIDPNDHKDAPARDTLITAKAVGAALGELGYSVEEIALTALTLDKQIRDAIERGTGTFFNMCETLDGELSGEPKVPEALDRAGALYTGSPAEVLRNCSNKDLTKQILQQNGLPVAWGFVLAQDKDIVIPDDHPEYPLFVKPKDGEGSVGIRNDSIVRNHGELVGKVKSLRSEGTEDVLVEKYIKGREFNVGLIETKEGIKVLPIAEIVFKNGQDIVSEDAKWEEGGEADRNTPSVCPAEISKELKNKLEDIAKRAFEAMGCRGYGRVDIRVDENDNPHVLEVNPNCGIAPGAGFDKEFKTSLKEEDKYRAYALMVEAILLAALA